jgi:hypothetical protein
MTFKDLRKRVSGQVISQQNKTLELLRDNHFGQSIQTFLIVFNEYLLIYNLDVNLFSYD